MTTEQQRAILDSIKAMTLGMAKDEKQKTQELLMMGVCIALDKVGGGICPEHWKALVMIGRVNKILGR